MNRILQALAAALLALPAPARADTLFLTNGNELEGIILWQDADRLEFQFAHAGSITFGRDEIREIVLSDAAGRESLRGGWAAAYEGFLAEMKAQREFEKSQREKGLLRDGGEWVTEKEFAARTEREKTLREAAAVKPAEKAPAEKVEVVYVSGPDWSAPVAAPVIVSYPIVDRLGRPDGYLVRRDFKPREKKADKVRDWKNEDPGTRDWRGTTLHERMSTAHWNFLHIRR